MEEASSGETSAPSLSPTPLLPPPGQEAAAGSKARRRRSLALVEAVGGCHSAWYCDSRPCGSGSYWRRS